MAKNPSSQECCRYVIDWFSPPIFILFVFFLVYILPQVYLPFVDLDIIAVLTSFNYFLSDQGFAIASLLAWVSFLFAAFTILVSKTPAKTIDIKSIQLYKVQHKPKLLYALNAFVSLALLLLIFFLLALGSSNSTNRIAAFQGINFLILPLQKFSAALILSNFTILSCISPIRSKQNKSSSVSKSTLALFVLVILFIIASILIGDRTSLFVPLLSIFIIRHFLIKTLSLGSLLFWLPMLVIVSSAYILLFREYALLGEVTSVDIMSASGLLFRIMGDFASENLAFINLWAIASSLVEPLNGSTYLAAILAFVPRFVFPEKPDSSAATFTDQYLNNAYTRQVIEGGTVTSVPPSMSGEALMNFGLVGPILAIVFLSLLYIHYYKKRYLVFRQCGVAIISVNLTNVAVYSFLVSSSFTILRGESLGSGVSTFLTIGSVYLINNLLKTQILYSCP